MRSLCIVPVFNQERELERVLDECNDLPCDQLLIVDDGSTDGSTDIIRRAVFPHIRFEQRIGIGHALIQGAKYALRHGFDVVVHMAGNGKMVPAEMDRLLEPLRRDQADYVWGSRFLPQGRFENAPLHRKYGIRFGMNLLPWLLFGKSLTDTTCGFRAYRLSILNDYAHGWDRAWLYKYEFEYFVLAKVLMSQYRYLEVPISMLYPPSKKNYSKITPIISWWSMLKPWLVVRLGWEPKNADYKPPEGTMFTAQFPGEVRRQKPIRLTPRRLGRPVGDRRYL